MQNGAWTIVDQINGHIRPGKDEISLARLFIDDSLAVRIEWNESASFDYLPLLECENLDINPTEVHMSHASHVNDGIVEARLSTSDDDYATLRPGECVDLAFSVNQTIPEGFIRFHQIMVEGRYRTISETEDGFAFHPNYPNPLNPSTNFSFSVPRAMDVKLEIFNILGQKVKTVVDGLMSPGPHTVIWDGNGSHSQRVASGVYFARFTAGDFVKTRKVVLLK